MIKTAVLVSFLVVGGMKVPQEPKEFKTLDDCMAAAFELVDKHPEPSAKMPFVGGLACMRGSAPKKAPKDQG